MAPASQVIAPSKQRMNRNNKWTAGRDVEIFTARCLLRCPDESDVPHIWSASRVPGFTAGMRWEPPAGVGEIRETIRRVRESRAAGTDYTFTAESRTHGDFIGWASIRRAGASGEWSLGFWVHPTRQRQGYATECASALLEFGFSTLRASVITAAHATWNTASGRVLRRIGMEYVRTNPRGFRKRDEWVEEFEYELRRR